VVGQGGSSRPDHGDFTRIGGDGCRRIGRE
jgi:hypothetical protein